MSFQVDTGAFNASLPQSLAATDSPTFANETLTGGLTTAGAVRSTYDGATVIPASATAGWEITSNYTNAGHEVVFWDLVNGANSGFTFHQKLTAITFAKVMTFFGDGTFVELDLNDGNFGGYYGDATQTILFSGGAGLPVKIRDQVVDYGVFDAAGFSVPSLPPAAANSTGRAGLVAWDAGFVYVCTATNTWKRVAIATWP